MKKILLIIATFIVLLLGLITLITYVNKSNNTLTSFLGYSSAISSGSSMSPNIKENELLIIYKRDKYSVNDIITFKNDEDIIVTHRIIDINDNKYITKGDNNNFTDGYKVKTNDIYGKVIYKCSFNKVVNTVMVSIVLISVISLLNLLRSKNESWSNYWISSKIIR